jgi:predicted flap endonuclease-1-like 5' DNA nuclease
VNRISRCLAFLFLALFAATSTQASHYPIEGVSFIPGKHAEALTKIGLEDTETLLAALSTLEKRKDVATRTQIPLDVLESYFHLCDLLQIRGIGPRMAQLLVLTGCTSTADLATRTSATLLEDMKKANQQHRISEILPQVDTLTDWIQQAKNLKTKSR